MITRNVFITGMVVLAAATFIFFPNTPPKGNPAPADGAVEAGAVGAGNFELFLAALAWRENEEGDPNKVCEDGCGCVGLYQITGIYVDDINKILSRWKKEIWEQIKKAGGKGLGGWFVPYTYDDRKDPEYSKQMVEVYLTYYGGSLDVDADWSTLARIHHGGPNGAEKEYTKGFGEDVVERMEALR